MLSLMLVVLECELHMQNGLGTPWEQGSEVDFILVLDYVVTSVSREFSG